MTFSFDTKIDYSRKRKTVSLRINNGVLYVKSPYYVSRREIKKIISSKISWIQKKIFEEDELKRKNLINFKNGDFLFYKGKKIELKIKEFTTEKIFVCKNFLNVHINSSHSNKNILKEKILYWYQNESHKNINKTVCYYKELMNLSVNHIKIGTYKSKWGSCTRHANLTFDWRIIMAPTKVMEYVVVHELSHIEHPNHSEAFWDQVRSFIPCFQIHRKWLRINSRSILNQFKN